MKRHFALIMAALLILLLAACGAEAENRAVTETETNTHVPESGQHAAESIEKAVLTMPEDFVLIEGGTFTMGSPETENWRSAHGSCLTPTSRMRYGARWRSATVM